MQNVIIIGSSGHAKVIIDIMHSMGKYEIIGIVDKYREIGEVFYDYKIIGHDHQVEALSSNHNHCSFFIAIGDNQLRSRVSEQLSSFHPSISWATAIHPSAIVAPTVTIGEGTAVMAGAVINCDTQIGNHCIINTRSSIDHDCQFDDFSSIAPGATIAGNVSVGKHAMIGLGANILQGVSIGENSIIGAGALLNKDCPDNQIMYGVPARFVRANLINAINP